VAFYRAHWPKLVAALVWAIPPGEDAEDVAQEAMARAYERWARVRAHERPDAWLFVTAYRLATSLRRHWAVRRRKLRAVPQPAADLFEGLILRDLLFSLEPRHRVVLLLRHHYGLSTRETARVLRCPEGTVKSLGSRARAALEAALSTTEEGSDGPS
jgi:RNA polymerase sigma-70 factor, ECF subfamily